MPADSVPFRAAPRQALAWLSAAWRIAREHAALFLIMFGWIAGLTSCGAGLGFVIAKTACGVE